MIQHYSNLVSNKFAEGQNVRFVIILRCEFDFYYILCGYQCDKAVNKNDTREVILHGFELSNQIGCNNLVGPIGLHLLF